jgi:hypothetical protein
MAEGKPHETQTGGLSSSLMGAVRAIINQGSGGHSRSEAPTEPNQGAARTYRNYARDPGEAKCPADSHAFTWNDPERHEYAGGEPESSGSQHCTSSAPPKPNKLPSP